MERIDWMNIGKEAVNKENRQSFLNAHVKPLIWEELYEGKTVAMMPGEGIKGIIREFKMPKVSHIAISNTMAPLGLYGIRARYKGPTEVDLIVLDYGDSIIPVCAVVKEQTTTMPDPANR